MHQTKSYWRMMALAGVVTAFIGSACVVTTDDGDNGGASGSGTAGSGTAGAAGSGTAGSGTAGSGTAGSGTAGSGTAGSGMAGAGPGVFECDMGEGGAAPGMPNSCDPQDTSNKCAVCVHDSCCTQFAECYATDPGNQCGWGGPDNAGEAVCTQLCIQDGVQMGGTAPDAELVGTCANKCLTAKCGSVIGTQTSNLIGCEMDHCQQECFGPFPN